MFIVVDEFQVNANDSSEDERTNGVYSFTSFFSSGDTMPVQVEAFLSHRCHTLMVCVYLFESVESAWLQKRLS